MATSACSTLHAFDRTSVGLLQAEMAAALEPIAAKYGIRIKNGGGTYGAADATLKFRCEVLDPAEGVEKQEVADWNRFASMYGLDVQWLGREVTLLNGRRLHRYTIAGLAPNSQKYPVVVEDCITKKRYKFPLDAIRAAIK